MRNTSPPPPLPPYLFLHILLASITKVYSPLLSTSVVYPILSDISKIMSSPMSTATRINTSPLVWNYLNTSWNPSYKPWILSLSPPSLWKTQPSNRVSSSTYTSNHLSTHFLTSIPDFLVSTNGNMCHFSPVPPLNRPFNVTIMCKSSFFFLVSSHNFSILF